MFKVDFQVKTAKWIKDPNLRWRAGLEGVQGAGMQFRQRLQIENYPPPPPMSTYVRTGTTAKKAGFRVIETGNTLTMVFGSTFYLPYLLYGTEHWAGWVGKKEEILQYMEAGFKQGIKDYKE